MDYKLAIRKIIRESISVLLENAPLADKTYFNTGKLSPKVKEVMLSQITHGDNYTKIIADIYYAYLQQNARMHKFVMDSLDGKEDDDEEPEMPKNDVLDLKQWKEIKGFYEQLKEYNKNVFPIKGLDLLNTKDIWNVINGLKQRASIIKLFKELPSIASRNMKEDIRKERTYPELQEYRSDLEYFVNHYSLLGNRNEELKQNIINKMFKSNVTLSQLLNFVQEKENLLGGADFTKEKIREIAETEDVEIIYEQGNIMIVEVSSPEGIKAVGCNSLWCFTYGSGFDNAYRQWNNYSYNDIVYVIIDFSQPTDSAEFMHVLIKPLINGETGRFVKYTEENEADHPLFNMANENYYSPYGILEDLLGPNYKKIVRKYLTFGY